MERRPSLQTGQANLSHPAFQSEVPLGIGPADTGAQQTE